jgi:hypothetical protein
LLRFDRQKSRWNVSIEEGGMLEVLRKASTPLVALLLAATLFVAYTAFNTANASHEPANKGAAAGSDLDTIGQDELLLSETMKVSSPEDLIVSVTAECSILTALTTNNDSLNSRAFGSVRLRVEIDGREVPVSVDDGAGGEDDGADDDDEIGEVTFCNRAYERTVADDESPADGVDSESDYIDTRTANAFNWIALDTGVIYDSPANGNNILTVNLFADYDTSTAGEAVAEAFVGSRTMVIEPIRLSIHEQVEPTGGEGS